MGLHHSVSGANSVFVHTRVYGPKCHSTLGLCSNMLYPLFQLFTGYIEKDDSFKLVVAQEITTLNSFKKKPHLLYNFFYIQDLLV